jgi:hypothetical protein
MIRPKRKNTFGAVLSRIQDKNSAGQSTQNQMNSRFLIGYGSFIIG